MKNILFYILVVVSVVFTACGNKGENQKMSTDLIKNTASASSDDENQSVPEFEFAEEVYEFGEITQGEKVETEFVFRNIGGADLIISDAKGSCGCTVPSYPTEPIAPGDKGVIKVVFNSNGKKGHQHKTVTLVANTVPNTKILAIKGDVIIPNNSNK